LQKFDLTLPFFTQPWLFRQGHSLAISRSWAKLSLLNASEDENASESFLECRQQFVAELELRALKMLGGAGRKRKTGKEQKLTRAKIGFLFFGTSDEYRLNIHITFFVLFEYYLKLLIKDYFIDSLFFRFFSLLYFRKHNINIETVFFRGLEN
jgi:hypothetical protein